MWASWEMFSFAEEVDIHLGFSLVLSFSILTLIHLIYSKSQPPDILKLKWITGIYVIVSLHVLLQCD